MDDWVRKTYEEHRGQLFRVAWLVLRRTDLAEDAVHTAFSRIIARPPRLNGNAKAYVLRAVRNAAIDLQRADARKEGKSLDECKQIGQDKSCSQSDEHVDAIYEALGKLDSGTQEIIHLHIHEQMTFREISELIEEPLQTVASRYRRGLGQIRATIDHESGPD